MIAIATISALTTLLMLTLLMLLRHWQEVRLERLEMEELERASRWQAERITELETERERLHQAATEQRYPPDIWEKQVAGSMMIWVCRN